MKKKILIGLVALLGITLSGCNMELLDTTYNFSKVHIYETGCCYDITSWTDYENGEQLQVNLEGYGKILISSYSCFLVVDECPICDK